MMANPFRGAMATAHPMDSDLILWEIYLLPDNQGDWVGSSKLFHVQKDHFYGHVSKLGMEEEF